MQPRHRCGALGRFHSVPLTAGGTDVPRWPPPPCHHEPNPTTRPGTAGARSTVGRRGPPRAALCRSCPNGALVPPTV
ncbi:hypothetical protein F750_4989 [Streptomyces sp. PAMC 26508]|nr:hypothetical protein F750_4989 [Streptomyces sp. PAMC 26508]